MTCCLFVNFNYEQECRQKIAAGDNQGVLDDERHTQGSRIVWGKRCRLNKTSILHPCFGLAILPCVQKDNNKATSQSMHYMDLYKLLQSSSPCYLRDLITVQPSQSTWSSTLVTLLQPSVDSSLKITNHFLRHAAPHLWNKLHPTLHVPYQSGVSSSPSSSPSSYWTACWPFS